MVSLRYLLLVAFTLGLVRRSWRCTAFESFPITLAQSGGSTKVVSACCISSSTEELGVTSHHIWTIEEIIDSTDVHRSGYLVRPDG